MLRLAQKLNAKLARSTPTAETSRKPTPTALPRKPNAGYQRWTPAEAEILLQCEQGHMSLTARLPDSDKRYQTLILGVDLLNNQLLLDSLFPALSIPQLADEQPFWLTLSLASGDYCLCVQPREILANHEMIVEIITTAFIDETPRSESINFSNKGPATQLRLSSGKCIQGYVKRLSTEQALVAISGSVGAEFVKPGTIITGTITFNDRFQIGCTARIASHSHKRGAHGQQFMLLDLVRMDAGDLLQLRAYIGACAVHSNAA